ncbi:Hypothetical predicted protein, partial [Mytilus galloprovincialis]
RLHENTYVKTITCGKIVCKGFSQRPYLQRHMKTHTDTLILFNICTYHIVYFNMHIVFLYMHICYLFVFNARSIRLHFELNRFSIVFMSLVCSVNTLFTYSLIIPLRVRSCKIVNLTFKRKAVTEKPYYHRGYELNLNNPFLKGSTAETGNMRANRVQVITRALKGTCALIGIIFISKNTLFTPRDWAQLNFLKGANVHTKRIIGRFHLEQVIKIYSAIYEKYVHIKKKTMCIYLKKQPHD